MELLGVGAGEALVVFVITLIVVGPQRFPEIARQAGRYYRMARRYAAHVTADVRGAMGELEAEVEAQKEAIEAVGAEIGEGIAGAVEETRGELRALERSTRDAVGASDGDAPDGGGASGGGAAPAAPRAGEPAVSVSPRALRSPRELPADGGEGGAASRRGGG